MTDFRYILDENGNVVSCGFYPYCSSKLKLNGDEPFTYFDCINWRFDCELNKWVSAIIDYQYLIIPTDLIPMLSSSSVNVQHICVDKFFTICLDNVSVDTIQQEGVIVPTLPVSFTPCSIIEFTDADASTLQGIIDTFNAMYDPPRRIDFNCHFANIQELESFIYKN